MTRTDRQADRHINRSGRDERSPAHVGARLQTDRALNELSTDLNRTELLEVTISSLAMPHSSWVAIVDDLFV